VPRCSGNLKLRVPWAASPSERIVFLLLSAETRFGLRNVEAYSGRSCVPTSFKRYGVQTVWTRLGRSRLVPGSESNSQLDSHVVHWWSRCGWLRFAKTKYLEEIVGLVVGNLGPRYTQLFDQPADLIAPKFFRERLGSHRWSLAAI
jgi:hypothetical protein